MEIRTEFSSGPIPPPGELAAYDEVVPGTAKQIVEAWRSETEHRHAMEKAESRRAFVEAILGRVLAFSFALFALGLAGYCVSADAPLIGAILGGGTIAAVVASLVQGRRG